MSDTCMMALALARAAQNKAIQQRRQRKLAARRRLAKNSTCQATPVTLSPSQQQGRAAEQLASRYLEQAGLEILQRNLHCRAGEIDLVCRDGQQLVFTEVRQRTSTRHGGAAATVDRRKQNRLIRAAQYYLPSLSRRFFNNTTPPCRFDVIAIDENQISWIKHAFSLPDT